MRLHNPLRDEVMRYIAGGLNSEHPEVDIGAPIFYNEPEFATEAGTIHNVTYYGSLPEYNGPGYFVYLTGSDGRVWEYGHQITHDLPDGTYVQAGQQIGRMGNSGWVSPNPQITGKADDGTHLHFGLTVNGVEVNPLEFIRNHNLEPQVSGGAIVEYTYVVTPDDVMGLESIIIKLYGGLDKYYEVLDWNPVLKANPNAIEVGQTIKYYKPAPPPAPTPVPQVNAEVEELEENLQIAQTKIAELQAEIERAQRDYAIKMVSEIQSREDRIKKLTEDVTLSNIAKAAEIDQLKKDIEKLKTTQGVFAGATKFGAVELVVDVLNEAGVFTKLIRKWEGFIDYLAARNIPFISPFLQTKSGSSLAKYDIFVLIGAEIVTWVANLTGVLSIPPEVSRFIAAGAIVIKQGLTLPYDTNKDGKLDIQDTQVLRQYLANKPVV